jgi:hypothetical protein
VQPDQGCGPRTSPQNFLVHLCTSLLPCLNRSVTRVSIHQCDRGATPLGGPEAVPRAMSYYLGGGGGYPQGNRAAPKSKDEDMEAAAALSALALGFAQPPSMQMPMQMPMPMPRSVPRPEEVPLRYLMGQQQRSPPMPPAPYYHRDSFDTWGQRRLDTPYQHLPASMEQALRGDQWEAPYEPYRYPPLWYQRERERQREWMASDMPPMSMQMPNRMMTVSRPPVYPPSRPPVSLPPPPQQHPQSVPPVARVAPSSARSSGGSEGMTRNESRNEKRRMQRAQMEKRKSSYRGESLDETGPEPRSTLKCLGHSIGHALSTVIISVFVHGHPYIG